MHLSQALYLLIFIAPLKSSPFAPFFTPPPHYTKPEGGDDRGHSLCLTGMSQCGTSPAGPSAGRRRHPQPLPPQFCTSKSTSSRRVALGSQNNFRVTEPNMTQELAHRCTSPAAAQPGSCSPLTLPLQSLATWPRGRHLPQKEMMWLLSSWTNFRVTASSMICFTCRMHRGGRERSDGVLHPRAYAVPPELSKSCLGCLGNPLFLPQPLHLRQICG